MDRRQFLQLGAWALLAAASYKLGAVAHDEPEQPLAVPVVQATGWGVPWRIDWTIGEQPIKRQYIPVIKGD